MEVPQIDATSAMEDVRELSQAFQNLGAVMVNAAVPAVEAFAGFTRILASDSRIKQLLEELIDNMHDVVDEYMCSNAEPADVVKYIVDSPNHTWMGVTIYPDEAWRYEHKTDWMWWRK
jgi:hypothetical protein